MKRMSIIAQRLFRLVRRASTPQGFTIELVGDLAGILYVAPGENNRGTAISGDPSVQHIAGHRIVQK